MGILYSLYFFSASIMRPALRARQAVAVAVLLASQSVSAVDYDDGQSLRVTGTNVIMREAPHQGARVLGTLDEYDHVIFTGEYTVDPITVTVRGERITAPYISVRGDNGDRGWVFAGLVSANSDLTLLKDKVQVLHVGSPRSAVVRLFGRDYVTHDQRMRSAGTLELLNQLGVRQAWEYYYFRTGEGVAFGFEDDRVAAIRVRQDTFDDDVTTYWRSVEGYLNHPLQPECHESPGSAGCDDYLR